MQDKEVQKQRKMWAGQLPTWDKSKLMAIAADRGYLSERSAVYAVSVAINEKYGKTRTMCRTGRFKWEQILVIGSLFEMTPKEFCDTFLAGYFNENDQGQFRAHLTDNEARAAVDPMPKTVHSKRAWESYFEDDK